ncbi:MAG: TIGR00153 family protein [Thermodesulforhabdaceae bacterium]|jgi:predicted phosphate transport protein (TIGR00153 family)
MFKRLFSSEKNEQVALQEMRKHLELLERACHCLEDFLKTGNGSYLDEIVEIEREGDIVRRDILTVLYRGAFLPYLRPSLYRFVEIVDETLDLVEDEARLCEFISIPDSLRDDALQIAVLNTEMVQMLIIAFDTFVAGDDLREKILAIRVYEKRIDDLYHDLFARLTSISIKDFWQGRGLADFFSFLVKVSDLIEDAADVLSLLHLSLT